MSQFRVDLHTHTCYSRDGWTRPRRLVERIRELDLDRVAITDHGEIRGALEARELDPERIIIGEEIVCRCGTELVGLFLTDRIEPRLPVDEVAERIRDQGGIVYAPHPFAYPREARKRAFRALAAADLAEVYNSRAFWPRWNRLAEAAVAERRIAAFAGSDAHFPHELGRAYTVMPRFVTAAQLLQSASETEPHGIATATPAVHLASVGLLSARYARGLFGTPLGSSPAQPDL